MRNEGFTFVEMLMALAVMAAFALSAHEALSLAEKRGQQTDSATDDDLRASLAIIGRDLHSAYLSATDDRTVFVARSDGPFGRLDFIRAAGSDGHLALMEIGFAVVHNADGGWDLWRRDSQGLGGDPTNGGARSLLCRDVSAFDIRVSDGNDWQREWGWDAAHRKPTRNIRGLPLLVSVHLAATAGAERREVTRVFTILTPLLDRCLHG